MSQEGKRCLVADQGGSDKVAQFKIEGRGSGKSSQRVLKENGISSFIYFALKEHNIVQTMYRTQQ